jgi:hypothetical protein
MTDDPIPRAPDVIVEQKWIDPSELAQRLDALEALVRALEAEVVELKARRA